MKTFCSLALGLLFSLSAGTACAAAETPQSSQKDAATTLPVLADTPPATPAEKEAMKEFVVQLLISQLRYEIYFEVTDEDIAPQDETLFNLEIFDNLLKSDLWKRLPKPYQLLVKELRNNFQKMHEQTKGGKEPSPGEENERLHNLCMAYFKRETGEDFEAYSGELYQNLERFILNIDKNAHQYPILVKMLKEEVGLATQQDRKKHAQAYQEEILKLAVAQYKNDAKKESDDRESQDTTAQSSK